MTNLIITGNKETILDNNLLISSESIAGRDLLRVDPSGNTIVINKNTAATATLDISGDVASSSTFNVQTNKLVVDSLGRVGFNVAPTTDLTIQGDVHLNGSLTVAGTITAGSTTALEVLDPNITINKNGTDATASNAGITIERTSDHAQLIWDNTRQNFRAGLVSNTTSLIRADGNSDGTTLTVGSNDNFALSLKTNNTTRVTVSNAGNVTFSGGVAIPSGDMLIQGISVKNGRMPPGTIMSFIPGTFGNSSNGLFTLQLGATNTVASVNSWLAANGYGHWKVCDGQTYTSSLSLLYNALGPGANVFNTFLFNEELFGGGQKYTPNLTDSRFLSGSTVSATLGGTNTFDHDHTVDTQLSSVNLTHSHTTTGTTALNNETVSLNNYTGNTGACDAPVPSAGHAPAYHEHSYGSHSHGPGTLKAGFFATGSKFYIRTGPSFTAQYVVQTNPAGAGGPFPESWGHQNGTNVLGSSGASSGTTGDALAGVCSTHPHSLNHSHSMTHTHSMPTATNHNHSVTAHCHSYNACAIPSAQFSHAHGTLGLNAVNENRPRYMTNFFIVKII